MQFLEGVSNDDLQHTKREINYAFHIMACCMTSNKDPEVSQDHCSESASLVVEETTTALAAVDVSDEALESGVPLLWTPRARTDW